MTTPKRPKHTITDPAGRVWGVYDFQIIAGVISKTDFGNGQYRGFAPVDGGARRTLLMSDKERDRGTSAEVLLEQLAKSELYRPDDPVAQASYGRAAERTDATR